jgi:hypothetical protein
MNELRVALHLTRSFLSLFIVLSTQLKAVRLKLIESLVDMINKLTEGVTHLKNDHIFLKQDIENLPPPPALFCV